MSFYPFFSNGFTPLLSKTQVYKKIKVSGIKNSPITLQEGSGAVLFSVTITADKDRKPDFCR
ncbi:MAG: hypothetical protein WCZ43_11735, partial [Proteiniphilum sp.]